MYKRVLLKLSGEALAGEDKSGINPAMVKHVVDIFGLPLGEIMLPIVVGHQAERRMPLNMKPATAERQRPILGQGQTRLGDGACVDAE